MFVVFSFVCSIDKTDMNILAGLSVLSACLVLISADLDKGENCVFSNLTE